MTITTTARPASRTGRDLPAIVDHATRSHVRAVVVLALFSLLMFLPGLFQVPPMDRDESRFAQASKQMVETGDYVDIRFLDEVRYKKPVGVYWLQAGVVKTARAIGVPDALTTIGLYRIPSLLGAIGAVLLTYWAALPFVARRSAVLAALMMAGSVLLGVEARLAKTDAVLLFTIIAAMGALARAYMRYEPDRKDGDRGLVLPAIFWTAFAAGFLIKGPVILLFVGLTVLTLAIADRSLQWAKVLRPAAGTFWFLLLVVPWFFAIVFRSGGSFFAGSVGHDMMLKVASGQESHGAPPGLYLLLFWFTFWPGAMLAGMAAPGIWRTRREKGIKFLLAWLVPAWIVFELVVTKLPHYVLPTYPAIAILIASVVERGSLSRRFWLELGTLWWLLVPLLMTGAVVAALVMFTDQLGLLAWPFAAAAVVFGLLAWRQYSSDGAERSLLQALVASLLIAVTVYAITMPSLSRLFPSVQLAQALGAADCRRPVAASAGFLEPSLPFLAGTSTVLASSAGAADFLAQGGCRFALVEGRSEPEFQQRARAIGLRYSAWRRVEGINYSNGRLVTVTLYRAEAQP
ncbi:MAG: phospholipid carrier-dependent glycosyltransferase [Rhizobiales bacterium]|nr:phospholipid carrier-dependent glycosyltransferase [Hyphomicrobiales bacterium]